MKRTRKTPISLKERTQEQAITANKKIIEAFHKLKPTYTPSLNTLSKIILYGTSQMAESYFHTNPQIRGLKLSPLKYPGAWNECSLNGALKEANQIKKAAEKLRSTVYKIHSNTYEHLFVSGFEVGGFERFLSALILMTEKAENDLERLIKENPKQAKKTKGTPEKLAPFQIAKILANEYYKAMGEVPKISTHQVKINPYVMGSKAYGQFIDLLETVFDTLNIDASPEAMARKVIQSQKKQKL